MIYNRETYDIHWEFPVSNKQTTTEVSLNDALSESSLNLFELEDSPYFHPQRNKRSFDQSITPGFQLASQFYPKAKKSLNKTPIPDKSYPVVRQSLVNKLEKTEVIETPAKDVCLPNASTDFIAFDPDRTELAPVATQKIISRIKSNSSTSEIQYSQKTGAHYFQRQRNMVEKNQENIIDDDISLCHNTQIYSSQFRRDLEQVFDDCEKSILQSKDEAVHEAVKGISCIDWDDDDFGTAGAASQVAVMKCAAKTQSSHGGIRLKPISSSTFSEMGPFFGLPNKVKMLIKEFKGIDELYGEFLIFFSLVGRLQC